MVYITNCSNPLPMYSDAGGIGCKLNVAKDLGFWGSAATAQCISLCIMIPACVCIDVHGDLCDLSIASRRVSDAHC